MLSILSKETGISHSSIRLSNTRNSYCCSNVPGVSAVVGFAALVGVPAVAGLPSVVGFPAVAGVPAC